MEVARNLNRHIFFESDSDEEAPVLQPVEALPAAPSSSSEDTEPYNVARYCEEAGIPRPKQKRSRRPDTKKWKAVERADARRQGKLYVSRYGDAVGKRRLGPACLNPYCRTIGNQCADIGERDRARIFTSFWRIESWAERQTFIKACTDTLSEGPQRIKNTWNLKTADGRRYTVCKKLVASTLGMSERTLYSWLGRKPRLGPQNSKAPKTGKTAPPAAEDSKFLEDWIRSIPTVPSHYCRQADTYQDKQFFEPGTSQVGLHSQYQEAAAQAGRRVFSINTFSAKLKSMKYSVFVPKKDQCTVCIQGKNRSISQAEYDTHRRAAAFAKTERNLDEERAKTDDTVAVFTMDLQAVTLCPRTQAAAMFYKTKLQIHNMVFFCKQTKDAHCYVFDESQGDLSSDTFAFLQRQFLDSILQKPTFARVTEVIFWSDGCGYQNQNAVVASSFVYLSSQRNVTITQKYLVKGHTMMEVDGVHAAIQRKLKNVDLYVPSDLVEGATAARRKPRPYEVSVVQWTHFTKLDTKIVQSLRPGHRAGDPTVHDLRALQYRPNIDQIFFKLKFDDDWQPLPHHLDRTENLVPMFESRLKINQRKFNDLQELKAVIPHRHHAFYDQIPH